MTDSLAAMCKKKKKMRDIFLFSSVFIRFVRQEEGQLLLRRKKSEQGCWRDEGWRICMQNIRYERISTHMATAFPRFCQGLLAGQVLPLGCAH